MVNLASFAFAVIELAWKDVLEIEDLRPVGIGIGVLLDELVKGNLEMPGHLFDILPSQTNGIPGSAACAASLAAEKDVTGHAIVVYGGVL